MKILVVFTGGTIGSIVSNNGTAITVNHIDDEMKAESYFLISNFVKKCCNVHKNSVEFEVVEPLTILSENMTVENWLELVKFLKTVDFSQYSGIVITHGTDTLAYSASFLGILLAGIKIPVVIVSANKNLSDPDTNGHQNFAAGIAFISQTKASGVFVSYAINNQKTIIYLATRITQSEAFFDDYRSIDKSCFGFVENDNFTPLMKSFSNSTCLPILYNLNKLDACVQIINPYIGLNYNNVLLNQNTTKAVLHTTYHSFTACTSREECSILSLKNKCDMLGIMLYIAPFSHNIARYESIDKILNAGIKTICNQSVESSFVKLLIAVNMFEKSEEVDEFLSSDLFYETL